MIRERCSCGAEFETDEKQALRLLNTWRLNHRHELGPTRDIETAANIETANNDQTPRTSIGFTTDPWEDNGKAKNGTPR